MIKYKLPDKIKDIERYIGFIKWTLLIIVLSYLTATFFYDVRVYHNALTFIRVVGMFIFTVFALNIYKSEKNENLVFLGISLGMAGVYDLIYMVFASQIIILNTYSQDIVIKLWVIARLIESTAFFITGISISKKIKLRDIYILCIIVFVLSLDTIFPNNIVSNLWILDTSFFIFLKLGIFILNIYTLFYHIIRTKVIGWGADKILILMILFTITLDLKFVGNIYEKTFLNFIVIGVRLVSYCILLNFIRLKVAEINHERNLYNFNKNVILEGALESSLDGIIIAIIRNDKKILYINHNFMAMIGYTKDTKELKYNQMIEILIGATESPEILRKQIYESIEKDEDYDINNILFKNGEVYKISSSKFIVKGESLGRVISYLNISESFKIKKLEHELEDIECQIDNLKELDSLKTEFVGNITHDFRTPITIIMSTLELWNLKQSKLEGGICLNQDRESLESIKQNCLRLLKLTNNLIDITRTSEEYKELDLKNHNIVSLIEEITMSVLNYSKIEKINLIFDTNTEEKIMACNSDYIERILLNLLSNAIKFTPSGGSIEVNFKDKGDLVIISIKDTGIGIPKEMHKDIFKPFKQVDSTSKREKEGSGIGLSLVNHLVEELGGEIYINPEVDIGTEFIIELPANLIPDNTVEEYTVNDRRLRIELSDI